MTLAFASSWGSDSTDQEGLSAQLDGSCIKGLRNGDFYGLVFWTCIGAKWCLVVACRAYRENISKNRKHKFKS